MTDATRDRPPAARSWDSHRPVRRIQALLVVVAALALVPAVASTVMRVFPPLDDATAMVASFIAYGLVGYAIALPLLLVAAFRSRRRAVLAVVSLCVAALTVLHLSWEVPFFVADGRPARTPTFTVMSLNLYKGAADSAQIAEHATEADVVILVETTPAALAGLGPHGWRARFPYSVGDLRAAASNTVIYSRFPLDRGTLIDSSFQQWLTTVQVPEVGAVTLMAVHPCNPFCGYGRWAGEHETINRIARGHLDQPLVMAGDFNAVDDHGPMRDLRRLGLKSATDVVGAGWLPTWPANRGYPPLIPLDHVLIDPQLTATAVRTFTVSGTDHRGVLATLAGA
jgi:endonuclease/exonuclease/phosphatase (EEP) superfamily protein YafD